MVKYVIFNNEFNSSSDSSISYGNNNSSLRHFNSNGPPKILHSTLEWPKVKLVSLEKLLKFGRYVK